MEIWEQTGNALGVQPYADGGFTGAAAANPVPGLVLGTTAKSSGDLSVNVENLNISNDTDEEALALRIGRMILQAAKRTAENSAFA